MEKKVEGMVKEGTKPTKAEHDKKRNELKAAFDSEKKGAKK